MIFEDFLISFLKIFRGIFLAGKKNKKRGSFRQYSSLTVGDLADNSRVCITLAFIRGLSARRSPRKKRSIKEYDSYTIKSSGCCGSIEVARRRDSYTGEIEGTDGRFFRQ